MTAFNKLKIFLSLFLILLVSSCKKEADMIIGEWQLEWSFVNSTKDAQYSDFKWIIMKDGSFIQRIVSPYSSEELKGNWMYGKEERSLKLTYTSTGASARWEIKVLDNQNLEVNYTTLGFFVERKFNRVN